MLNQGPMVANLTGSKFSLTMVTMSATSALNWMMVNLRPDMDAHFQTNYTQYGLQETELQETVLEFWEK